MADTSNGLTSSSTHMPPTYMRVTHLEYELQTREKQTFAEKPWKVDGLWGSSIKGTVNLIFSAAEEFLRDALDVSGKKLSVLMFKGVIPSARRQTWVTLFGEGGDGKLGCLSQLFEANVASEDAELVTDVVGAVMTEVRLGVNGSSEAPISTTGDDGELCKEVLGKASSVLGENDSGLKGDGGKLETMLLVGEDTESVDSSSNRMRCSSSSLTPFTGASDRGEPPSGDISSPPATKW